MKRTVWRKKNGKPETDDNLVLVVDGFLLRAHGLLLGLLQSTANLAAKQQLGLFPGIKVT